MAANSWQQRKPQVLEVLRSTFGFEGFRGVQEQAVQAALQGRDTFVLMPTGGGKSLCYALPAAVTGGLVLVVPPLIALMQDQVAALQAVGLAADYLSSTRTAAERNQILGQLTPSAAAAANTAAAATAGAGASGSSGSNGGGSHGSSGGSSGSSGRLALLYVTPELIATDSFRQRLRTLHTQSPGRIKLIAVDEAHCISSWGHDYRPTYRQLSKLRAVLKGVPCMALTATATPQVRQDVLSSLQLSNPAVLTSSFNRPNIHYSIILLDVQQPAAPSTNSSLRGQASSGTAAAAAAAAGGAGGTGAVGSSTGRDAVLDDGDGDGFSDDADHAGYGHLLQLLKRPPPPQRQQRKQQQGGQEGQRRWPGPIAIVYCLKRSTVDAVTRRLRGEGLAAAAYHAALPAATRGEVLQQWRAGQLQVVCASVAFGMGVDKGDIELVVHYNLPRSVEGFYQESGRAGRNGQPASSVLMYSTRDRRRMDYILQKDAGKKASRKRKKQATESAAAAAAAGSGAGGGMQDDSSTNSAVAAAALHAFGGVVDLCCTSGCRRQRLLNHFGEQQQQRQRERCCDHCDDAALVESALQQLQLFEQQALSRRFGGQQGGGRRSGGKRDLTYAGFEDFSDEEEGSGAASSDEGGSGDDQADPEVAAALAAALAAAKAVANRKQAPGSSSNKAARGRQQALDTDAFLTAMMKAEGAHERSRAAAADGGGGGDKLEQLLLARKGCGQQAAAAGGGGAGQPLTQDLRASRRAKLAGVIASNSNLEVCTQEAADVLAAAYERSVAVDAGGGGGNAEAHRTQLMAVVTAVKQAGSWLELPKLSLLCGPGLEAALRQGVAQVVEAAGGGGGAESVQAAETGLRRLAQLSVTADALEATGVAAAVKKLRKHQQPSVAAAAVGVVAAWRQAVTRG